MNRRNLFKLAAGSIGVAFIAKVVPATSLPRELILYGDGIHDDWAVLQAWIKGQTDGVTWADTGKLVGLHIYGRTFFMSQGLDVVSFMNQTTPAPQSITYCVFMGNSYSFKR